MKYAHLILGIAIAVASTTLFGFRPVAVSGPENLALSGYDVVELVNDEELVKGVAYLHASYQGAEWRFVTQPNLEAFKADPEKYQPAFGGYCAVCVSGVYPAIDPEKPAVGDPKHFFVYNEKVYVFYSEALRKQFAESPEQFVSLAEKHWNRWQEEGKIEAAEPS